MIGTGYLEHMVRDAVASWFPGLDVTFVSNPDFRSTNNAYSLLLTRPHVDAGREPEPRVISASAQAPRISCTIGEKMWQDRWGGRGSTFSSRYFSNLPTISTWKE